MKKVEIYVQARMGSTRLPGKVVKEVLGRPLLSYLLERLKRVSLAQTIYVLTTQSSEDDVIIKECRDEKVPVFRGSSEDVLSRYYLLACERKPDAIVRITADCPLIDPAIIDSVIKAFLEEKVDYASNTIHYTYPRGMDVEVFSFKALERAYKEAMQASEKEHVTLYMYRHPELFQVKNVAGLKKYSSLRLTVDTQEDFELIKRLLEELYPKKPSFTLEDIIATLKEHPEWQQLNAHIQQRMS